MAVESVKEVLSTITSEGTPNRFSKKNFNKLMKAILNDTEFAGKMAVVKNKELQEGQEIMVTQGFRKFLKNVIEKAGIDKSESEMVMNKDFTIDNVDGLYEFISTALFTYMDAGNTFDFIPQEDFKGSLNIKKVKADTKVRTARNPQTGEELGTFEYESKAYRALSASSPCPAYLTTRRKLNS